MQANVRTSVDTQALKGAIDLPAFAARYSTLRRWAAAELAGPCPNCGGTDRFHVHAEGWWKCYRCHPKPSDAIGLVMWAERCAFRSACDRLDPARLAEGRARGATDLSAQTCRQGAVKGHPHGWQEPGWQSAAQRELERAVAGLASAEGEAARDYLLARGVLPETWTTWQIGYATPYHPSLRAPRPALVLPWLYRGTLKALQYRFFGEGIDQRTRFGCRSGGERTVFGLDRLSRRWGSLLLVEGEINALSLWQAARKARLDDLDVVSIGSESNIANPTAAWLAARYAEAGANVVIWADEGARVRQFMAALPGACGLRSPDGLDANDLLQRGLLEAFLPSALAACGRRPAGPQAVNLNVDPRADPRPDLAEDTALWAELLAGAYRQDGQDPYGVFGALQGARICGARICGARICGARICGARICGARLAVAAGPAGGAPGAPPRARLITTQLRAQDLALLEPYRSAMEAYVAANLDRGAER